MFPKKLQQKLNNRKAKNALRKLGNQNNLIDFSTNDYLGFAKSETIFKASHDYLQKCNIIENGATGSRLLSGNHKLYNEVETMLCEFHNSESALVFNSGYDANLGFFSSVPQRGDFILYDEFSHASIRDGIQLSKAKSYKFKHNNLVDLENLIFRHSKNISEFHQNIYVVTESVFSMDGDSPNLVALTKICKANNIYLIVDEAHAIGVFGEQGKGLIQELGLENSIFARLITFGKALGCHGAAVLGSQTLKDYLINFARSFIYTTALPPHTLATINSVYNELYVTQNRQKLHQNIAHFKSEIIKNNLQEYFIKSNSSIHCCIISGNDKVKLIAFQLHQNGFNVKPILSPTVSKGEERLRFCLHSYNSFDDITKIIKLLTNFVK